MSTDQLLKELLRLPVPERARVAQKLLDSLEEPPEEVEQAWASELLRRSRDLKEGQVEPVSWETIEAHIEQDLQNLRDDRLSS